MKIEGSPNPRFRACTLDHDGQAHECVFECDTLAQLDSLQPRADRRYVWKVDGHWQTPSEFSAWKVKAAATGA
jgi:hypothetical protein